jgi:hypothetical protein
MSAPAERSARTIAHLWLQGQMQRAVTRHLQPAAAKSVEASRRGVGVTERGGSGSPSPRHLPPLAADGVESSCVEDLRRANLKELRQVRRGLRKARLSLAQSPLQADTCRRQGEAAGTQIVRRIRREAVRAEHRTAGLVGAEAQQADWRAHLARVSPSDHEPLNTPARLQAERQLQLLHDTTPTSAAAVQGQGGGVEGGSTLDPVQQFRSHVQLARSAVQGGDCGGAALVHSSEWQPGDFAEALVAGTGCWHTATVIGSAEKMAELTVMLTEGRLAGEFVEVERKCLRRPRVTSTPAARLAQARQAHADLVSALGAAEASAAAAAAADTKGQQGGAAGHHGAGGEGGGGGGGGAGGGGGLGAEDRQRLSTEIAELQSEVEALEYSEQHARRDVPLEVSRFMRLRIGILHRGRNRRRQERTFPPCARCGVRARGSEDTTNGGAWYCRGCWVEWECSWRHDDQASPVATLPMAPGGVGRRTVAGSWIRSGCNRQLVNAGTTLVSQRHLIASLQAEVSSLAAFSKQLQSAHLEREELCELADATQDTQLSLQRIRAITDIEQATQQSREATTRSAPPGTETVASASVLPPRRQPFPVLAASDVATAIQPQPHSPLPESSLRTAMIHRRHAQHSSTA